MFRACSFGLATTARPPANARTWLPHLPTTAAAMIQQKSWLDKVLRRPDPKELVRTWQAALRKEQRGIERQIMGEFRW